MREILKWLARVSFVTGQRFGVDLLPRHYYSEVPHIRDLRRKTSWLRPYSMSGVSGFEIDAQLGVARRTCEGFPLGTGVDTYELACAENGAEGFGPVEMDFLERFIHKIRPRRIVQIGCGVATAGCLIAARNLGYCPSLTCIDPYPTSYLKRLGDAGTIDLIEEEAQDVSMNVFSPLVAGDLFFVDSTHTLGPAGEVTRIVLDVLPNLPAGVWVHFHDIGFPYDYSRHILSTDLFFAHETALLLAFLTYNPHYRLEVSLSMLHYFASADLSALLPRYRPAGNREGLEASPGHFPSSAYLRSV